MEFQQKTRREPLKLLVPGLDNHPAMARISELCEQVLSELDDAVCWSTPTNGQRDNNVIAFRHKARGSLSEAMLNAFAAIQHKEHSSGR